MTWYLNGLASLHWRRWDSEWVVFDVGSGQTHQMDTLTAATLMMIESGIVDSSGLLSAVAEELLLPNDSELLIAVTDVLEKLTMVGLIESNAT